jgi:hypothetical protein
MLARVTILRAKQAKCFSIGNMNNLFASPAPEKFTVLYCVSGRLMSIMAYLFCFAQWMEQVFFTEASKKSLHDSEL